MRLNPLIKALKAQMLDFESLKLLSLLVYPLTQVVLLLLLGLYLYTRRRSRGAGLVLCVATLWLWLSSMPFVADHLMGQLEQAYPPVQASQLPKADAIVLLGGAVRGEPSPQVLADMSGVGDRLLFAVAAFKAGRAPLIVVTGGGDDGEVAEATLIRDILVTMGVPQANIVLEKRNRVTLDNLRYTRQTLQGLQVQSVLLVTSAFHMRRALWVFAPLDLTVYSAPTDYQVLSRRISSGLGPTDFLPSVKALQRTTWAIHEQVGYWYYRWLKA